MKRLFFIVSLFVLFSCNKNIIKELSYPSDLVQLHDNLINYLINQEIDEVEVKELLNSLQEDGSWLSIDYTNKERGGWPVKIHLQYLQNIAISYKKKNSKYFEDKDISKKIHLALNYWLENDFLSTNWHDQHIGVPELLLPTLFLIENELSEAQLGKAMVLLHRAKIKMSGQNKVWLSTNVMLRSLLLRKSDSVAIASKAIQDELQISKSVGVKSDWSYHEHGAQLQFGNYGLSYLEDMIKCYTLVSNSPFKFEESKIEFLRNYILNGQQWVIWNDKYDVNASGRQLFENEVTNKYKRLAACLQKMKVLDTEYSNEYDKALNSKILSGNKHFWKSDFQIHRRKDFYFSVKMSSKRVVGTESVNKENIQGYYMGDGVALLSSNGEEYNNIFPFWDWKKLPGTTIIQDTSALPIIKFSGFKTNSVFVGGVTNGENGIAVMDYNRDGLQARKAWFMFDDKVVCLGNGINSNINFPVTTTVNQVFLKGGVISSKDDKIEKISSLKSELSPDWMLHDSIGYLFPNKDQVKLTTNILEGSWNYVAKRYRPVILTEHIFKLWIDHGLQPKNKSYSYILVPNASKEVMTDLHKNRPFNIINTKNQQSVETIDGKKSGIIFYSEGKSNIRGGISVNNPCVMLLEDTSSGLILSVSDPSQTLTQINVSVTGKYKADSSQYSNEETQITIQLPDGDEAGKTVTLQLQKLN